MTTGKNHTFSAFSPMTFLKPFTGFPQAGLFDFSSLFETQRKNIEALTEAQQVAVESWQTVRSRQNDMLSRMAAGNAALAREMMAESSPEQKIARQVELIQDACEETMSDWRDISETISQSCKETSEILTRIVSGSLDGLPSGKEGKAPSTRTAKKAA